MALAIGGIGLYSISTYIGYHAYRIYQLPPAAQHDPQQQRNYKHLWDTMGDYDARIDSDEYWLGITSKRARVIEQAAGSVLEVCSGTSRNIDLYRPDKVDLLIQSDESASMLNDAIAKYQRLKDKLNGLEVVFTKMPATALEYSDNSFDTVVDTFGLCSCQDPIKMIKEMGRVCKPDGKILLLEHGRGFSDWLNDILDRTVEGHAMKWGCHWNRDIMRLVEESGLAVQDVERFHFGTTMAIVLQPNRQSTNV